MIQYSIINIIESFEKCKSKLQYYTTHTHEDGYHLQDRKHSDDKDMETLEASYLLEVMCNGATAVNTSLAVPQKVKCQVTWDPAFPFPTYTPT